MLGLATPLLTVLFSLFALFRFKFFKSNIVAIALFLVLVLGIFYGSVFFVKEAIRTLPEIVATSLPRALDTAEKWGIELPFSDLPSLKSVAVTEIRGELRELTKFTQKVTKEFVFLLIGLVVAVSIFLNSKVDLNEGTYPIKDNLYTRVTGELANRFSNLYRSFSVVMGAQLVISLINTAATSIFVLLEGLPYPHVINIVTFLCSLLPIIGNLISNTLICGVALTKSPAAAAFALLYLVAIHKAEYFLNSKIIGGRIRNPMWLTLLALIGGERLMGIPGMILAPVILNYLKIEGSQIDVKEREISLEKLPCCP